MRLVVSGGSGFLGRRIAREALRAGDAVVVPTRDPQRAAATWAREQGSPAAGAPEPEWLATDLADPRAFARAVAGARPDGVLHAAALIRGGPAELRAVNADATAVLVSELARAGRRPRFVYVSSFAVEDEPPTPYSESKHLAEEHVRASGLPWVILRPALVYGPGDTDNTPRLVEAMAAGTMWLPAGGSVRIQPVHVDDVAAAAVAALHRDEAVGGTFRLGGPEPVPVRAFREAVRDATGGRAVIRAIPLPLFALAARAAALLGRTRALEVLRFHRADHGFAIDEARRALGFSPRPLAQGLAETFGERPASVPRG